MKSSILNAQSLKKDPEEALRELAQSCRAFEASFSILFVAPHYSREALTTLIPLILGTNVFGCTSAGEIGPLGIASDGMCLMSFHGESFVVNTRLIEKIDQNLNSVTRVANELKKIPFPAVYSRMCLLLIDGLSLTEEVVAGQTSKVFAGEPVIGGSAGDDLNFKGTWVWGQDKFHTNAALLLTLATDVPFFPFKSQHAKVTEKKLIITGSRPASRVVTEINGYPAAQAYAQEIGLRVTDLTDEVYSKYPLALKSGGSIYIRSIAKVNDDQSLTFFCAIENGMVLSLARSENLLASTESTINDIATSLPSVQACLVFECIQRRLEYNKLSEGERATLNELYKTNHFLGFHTYGEQYAGFHINQTITGVAFGRS